MPNAANAQLIVKSSFSKNFPSGAPSATGQGLISPFRPDKTDNKIQFYYSPLDFQVMGIKSGDVLDKLTFLLKSQTAMASAPTGKVTIRLWQSENSPNFPIVATPGLETAVNNVAPILVPNSGAINIPVTVLSNKSLQMPALSPNLTMPFTIKFSNHYVIDNTKYLTIEISKDSSFVGAGAPATPVLYEGTIGRTCLTLVPDTNVISPLVALTMAGSSGNGFLNGITESGTNCAGPLGAYNLIGATFSFRPTVEFGITRIYDNYTIEVGHNWINNGMANDTSFIAGMSTVKMISKNTFVEDTIGGTQATRFYNLELKDTANLRLNITGNPPGGGVYPYDKFGIQINNQLMLTQGKLLTDQHVVFIANASPSAIVRPANGGSIISENTLNRGRIKWKINQNKSAHTFPFGTSTDYIPFTFKLNSGNAGDVIVSTYHTGSNNTPLPTSPDVVTNLFADSGLIADNSANVVDRFWQINKTSTGAINADLEFVYQANELPANRAAADMRAQRYNKNGTRINYLGVPYTGIWMSPASSSTLQTNNASVYCGGCSNAAFALQAKGVKSLSPWTLSAKQKILKREIAETDLGNSLSITQVLLSDQHIQAWLHYNGKNNLQIAVYDLTGKCIYNTTVKNNGSGPYQIEIPIANGGMYIINANDGAEVDVAKFVITE